MHEKSKNHSNNFQQNTKRNRMLGELPQLKEWEKEKRISKKRECKKRKRKE